MIGMDMGKQPTDAASEQPLAHRPGSLSGDPPPLPLDPYHPGDIGGVASDGGLDEPDCRPLEPDDPVVPDLVL